MTYKEKQKIESDYTEIEWIGEAKSHEVYYETYDDIVSSYTDYLHEDENKRLEKLRKKDPEGFNDELYGVVNGLFYEKLKKNKQLLVVDEKSETYNHRPTLYLKDPVYN